MMSMRSSHLAARRSQPRPSSARVHDSPSRLRRAAEGLYLLGRYGLRRRVTVRVEGAELIFSTADAHSRRWFYPRYAKGEIHEEPVTRLMAEELRHCSCFVDAGAHLGFYTCLASRLMPDGVIHAFEMSDRFHRLCVTNVALNTTRSVGVHKMAVCESSEQRAYTALPRYLEGPTLQLDRQGTPDDARRQVLVKGVSLDDFFASRCETPDLVKIDVEGSEIDVLLGMRGLLKAPGLRIFVEVHPQQLSERGSSGQDVVNLLMEHGFAVREIEHLRGGHGTTALRKLRPDSPILANTMLFARRSGDPDLSGGPEGRATKRVNQGSSR